jgi:hypothetical protein
VITNSGTTKATIPGSAKKRAPHERRARSPRFQAQNDCGTC